MLEEVVEMGREAEGVESETGELARSWLAYWREEEEREWREEDETLELLDPYGDDVDR